jgi:diguanylate cyclase
MEYNHSKPESAEYLRLALPHMAKHDAPMHPISYAVWYEYVAGMNQALSRAIDTLAKPDLLFNGADIEALFNQYIADITPETATMISHEFQRIINNLAESTGAAARETEQFDQTLQQFKRDSGLASGESINIQTLLKGIQSIESATRQLKGRLAESQNEIEALREEVIHARDVALLDSLTGLFNRRGFDQTLATCLNELVEPNTDRTLQPCLLMCDIDHFKQTNDTYGHLFGDRVIRAVAQAIKNNVKGRDTAARYGGEEFVILLPDTPLEGALALAEKLRHTVEHGRIKRGTAENGAAENSARITVSIGVARFMPGESSASFIDRADQALYKAKRGGRNQVCEADDPSMPSGSKVGADETA